MPALSHRPRPVRALTLLVGISTLLIAACSGEDAPKTGAAASTSSLALPSPASVVSDIALTGDYRSGLAAEMRMPEAAGPAALIVVVPGGGWSTAKTDYIEPFAQDLTAAGNTTSLITYGTTWDGARFPEPADDVACAVRWSAAQAARLGFPPSQVVVAGHSAGGHLATLVALSGDEFGGDCEWSSVTIDGVIGMAGVYDSTSRIDGLDALFDGNDTAQSRALGSPLEWADSKAAKSVRVLLLHGADDAVVAPEQAERLASALDAAGGDVQLTILPGQRHDIPVTSEDVVPAISAWLAEG